MEFQAVPIIRIFDEQKAKDFYLGFFGMSLDWEHRFEANFPIYMQVSRDHLVLYLSEHSGHSGIKSVCQHKREGKTASGNYLIRIQT